MPSNSQGTILNAFNQAAGGITVGADMGGVAGGLASGGYGGLQDALAQATQVINAETDATSANTEALGQNTQSKGGSGGGGVSDVVDSVTQFVGGGLSLMPLVSIFSGLFGGGGSQESSPLAPYTLPQPLNMQTTNNYQDVTWGNNGLPRTGGGQSGSGGFGGRQQITVQVQAMDSQSFLDHSDDIAQAVRQAMLNMNSINDVVNDL